MYVRPDCMYWECKHCMCALRHTSRASGTGMLLDMCSNRCVFTMFSCAVQADRVKLLPWSPAMTALFIDPSRLTQGGPLAGSTTGAHTHSGTYTRTDSSQPIQVCMWCLILLTYERTLLRLLATHQLYTQTSKWTHVSSPILQVAYVSILQNAGHHLQ